MHILGVKVTEIAKILQHLGFVAGDIPFKYLSIKLSTKKLTLLQWQLLIDRIVKKISSWIANLSYAGRI